MGAEKNEQKNPKISVLTVCLNKSQFLEECIESVLCQDYGNFEYIIIDGGSTDGSVDIIEKYRDRLAYFTTGSDKGQSDAINKGLAKAKGSIVGWIHADDKLLPNALKNIAEAFGKFADSGLVYGSGYKIGKDGEILKHVVAREFDHQLLKKKCFIFQPSAYFKLSVLRQIGFVNANSHYWMDWEVYLKISKKFSVCRTDKPIGIWRDHPETKSRDTNAEWLQKAEMARIARRENGIIDPNYLMYKVIIVIRLLTLNFRLISRGKCWDLLKMPFDKLFGENSYMMSLK